jgi:hypothetical protein
MPACRMRRVYIANSKPGLLNPALVRYIRPAPGVGSRARPWANVRPWQDGRTHKALGRSRPECASLAGAAFKPILISFRSRLPPCAHRSRLASTSTLYSTLLLSWTGPPQARQHHPRRPHAFTAHSSRENLFSHGLILRVPPIVRYITWYSNHALLCYTIFQARESSHG